MRIAHRPSANWVGLGFREKTLWLWRMHACSNAATSKAWISFPPVRTKVMERPPARDVDAPPPSLDAVQTVTPRRLTRWRWRPWRRQRKERRTQPRRWLNFQVAAKSPVRCATLKRILGRAKRASQCAGSTTLLMEAVPGMENTDMRAQDLLKKYKCTKNLPWKTFNSHFASSLWFAILILVCFLDSKLPKRSTKEVQIWGIFWLQFESTECRCEEAKQNQVSKSRKQTLRSIVDPKRSSNGVQTDPKRSLVGSCWD